MLYLIDKPLADIGLRTAADDSDAHVVLIQDGVFLDPAEFLDDERTLPTYAVERDLEVRGVTPPEGVEPIEYDELVGRIVAQEVKTFV